MIDKKLKYLLFSLVLFGLFMPMHAPFAVPADGDEEGEVQFVKSKGIPGIQQLVSALQMPVGELVIRKDLVHPEIIEIYVSDFNEISNDLLGKDELIEVTRRLNLYPNDRKSMDVISRHFFAFSYKILEPYLLFINSSDLIADLASTAVYVLQKEIFKTIEHASTDNGALAINSYAFLEAQKAVKVEINKSTFSNRLTVTVISRNSQLFAALAHYWDDLESNVKNLSGKANMSEEAIRDVLNALSTPLPIDPDEQESWLEAYRSSEREDGIRDIVRSSIEDVREAWLKKDTRKSLKKNPKSLERRLRILDVLLDKHAETGIVTQISKEFGLTVERTRQLFLQVQDDLFLAIMKNNSKEDIDALGVIKHVYSPTIKKDRDKRIYGDGRRAKPSSASSGGKACYSTVKRSSGITMF